MNQGSAKIAGLVVAPNQRIVVANWLPVLDPKPLLIAGAALNAQGVRGIGGLGGEGGDVPGAAGFDLLPARARAQPAQHILVRRGEMARVVTHVREGIPVFGVDSSKADRTDRKRIIIGGTGVLESEVMSTFVDRRRGQATNRAEDIRANAERIDPRNRCGEVAFAGRR